MAAPVFKPQERASAEIHQHVRPFVGILEVGEGRARHAHQTEIPREGNADEGQRIAFQVYDEAMHRTVLPKFIVFGAVFKAGFCKPLFEVGALDIEVVAKRVERRILVAQFHVDDAEQHHRVVGKLQGCQEIKTFAKDSAR